MVMRSMSVEDGRVARVNRGLPPDHVVNPQDMPEPGELKPLPGPPASLPPIVGEYPTDSAFFVCCDSNYLRNFGIVLLRSVAEHSPGARVHLHLMNPDFSLMRFVEPLPLCISLTHEACSKNAIYYHAARLVRFSEALESCSGSLLMTDTDAIAMGDIRGVLNGPLALRVRPGRMSSSERFSACFIRGDASSRPYFRRASEIVRCHFAAPWWGLDQYALYAAWVDQRPAIHLVGPDMASVVEDQPGLFWFTAGLNKKTLMTDATPYAREYQRIISISN